MVSLLRPPMEKRETQRTRVAMHDREMAFVQHGEQGFRARVIDFSPFGVGVAVEEGGTLLPLVQGDTVTITLRRADQDIAVRGVLMTKGKITIGPQTFTRLGFKIQSLPNEVRETRKNRRFLFASALDLSAVSPDPSRPGENAFYIIKDLSRRGLLLETSARNKFLLQGLRLTLSIRIPGGGEYAESVTVKHVHALKERYLLGCSFDSIQARTLEAIGAYTLSHGKDASYQVMIEEGFPLGENPPGISVQVSQSYQDFLQISELRLLSAQERGEALDLTDSWQMIEREDENAQHICVKFGKRVVASARLLYRPGLLHEPCYELGQLVVHPEFRGSQALLKIWEEVLRTVQASGVPNLVLGADESRESWVLTHQLGFQTEMVLGQPLRRLELARLWAGRGLRFRVWSVLVAPLLDRARDEAVPIAPGLRLRLALARSLRPMIEAQVLRSTQTREGSERDRARLRGQKIPLEPESCVS